MPGRTTLLLFLILICLVAATIALAAVNVELFSDELAEPVATETEPEPVFEVSGVAPPITGPMTDPAADLDANPSIEPEEADEGPTTVPAPIAEAREVVDNLFDYSRWIEWGQRALLIAIVVVIALIIMRIGRRILLNVQEARNIPDSVMLPIRRTLRGLVILFAVIIALQFAGFQMATIWASLAGVLALIGVGFIAVWSVLSNVACSFMLMMFKPFRIGDMIEIVENAAGPNVGGRVTDVTLMYVVLREETDEGPAFIQIPNNLFFQKTVRRRAGRRAIPIEQHVEKHGLAGREQQPPSSDAVTQRST